MKKLTRIIRRRRISLAAILAVATLAVVGSLTLPMPYVDTIELRASLG